MAINLESQLVSGDKMKTLAILLCIVCFAVCSCKEKARADSNSTANSPEQVLKQDECTNAPITIEIDGHQFKAPREGLIVTLKNHETRSNLLGRCDVETIQDAVAASWANFEIIKKGFPSERSGATHKLYLSPEFQNSSQILPNGTKRIQTSTEQVFVLPYQENATFDDDPVIIVCHIPEKDQTISDTTHCTARYDHASGLSLGYRFFRKGTSEEEFIRMDQQMRKQLESMIIESEIGSPQK